MPVNRLVEDSYYEHQDHGMVKLVSVDATKVAFQLVDRHRFGPSRHRVLSGKYEGVTEFKRKVEPADVTVNADLVVVKSEGRNA